MVNTHQIHSTMRPEQWILQLQTETSQRLAILVHWHIKQGLTGFIMSPIRTFMHQWFQVCHQWFDCRGSWLGGGETGPWPTKYFRNRRILRNFDTLSENFCTFAVGKDKGFQFYRKIIELGRLTLQVPRRPYLIERMNSVQYLLHIYYR